MLRPLFLLLAVLLAWPSFGQGLMARKRKDIIPLEGQAKRIGWFIGPGLTYTLAPFREDEREMFRNADTLYRATYDARGRLGLYLEGGLTWYTRDPLVVDYFDVGLAYKNLRGAEAFDGVLQRGDSLAPLAGEGSFAERMLTFSANANKFIPTRSYQFVQLSLGANVDYRLGQGLEHTGDPRLNDHGFPPDLWAQAHFKVGYGFKLTGHTILIPAIETPIFSFSPTDINFGRLQWFSSTYRPLILSVRFLFLRARNGFDCPPPVREPGGKQGKHKQYTPQKFGP